MSLPPGQRKIVELLRPRAVSGAAGLLKAVRNKHRRLFCVDGGALTFAASNVIEEQFEAWLEREGRITAAERDDARRVAGERKVPAVTALVAGGILSDTELEGSMPGWIAELLFDTFKWHDGEFEFVDGRPDLANAATCRAPIPELMACYGESDRVSIDAVRAGIGSPGARLKAIPDAGERLGERSGGEVVGWLLEHCDGRWALNALLPKSPASTEETLRAVYGLLLGGILEAVTTKAVAVASEDSAGPVTEDELLGLLSRTRGADHYGVLGLTRQATETKIRDSYYALARRFHPDRFRAGALAGHLHDIEAFFRQVTDAYNTLIDPERREEYHRVLDLGEAKKDQVEAQPEDLARLNYLRGKELASRRRYTEAVRFLENALELDSTHPAYHLELGRVLAANPRRREEAVSHLDRARTLDPSSVEAHLELANALRKLGREEQAAGFYRQVLQLSPNHPEATAALRG